MSVSNQTGQSSAKPGAAQDDMRDLLRELAVQIKGQIADVDRRHSDAMREMEARMQPAVRQSTSAHATVAMAGAADALEPWDTASAEMLTRIYEADGADGPAHEANSTPPTVFFSDPPVPQHGPVNPAPKLQPGASAPLPAKPSIPTVELRQQAVKQTSERQGMQPGSQHSATGLPSPQGRVASAMVATPAPSVEAPTELLARLASDRAWLDGRLTAIASRVEQSLIGFDPSAHLSPINHRIDALQLHIDDALSTVVRKPDLARFAGLESEVSAVKDQVAAARGQLKRLDGIEDQLRDLSAYAASAQDAPLTDGPTPAPTDFQALAERTADQVAQRFERFTAAQKPVVSPAPIVNVDGLQDMHALLNTYVAEHRRDQSQSATVLNTMQEALIRLIDRIEELAGEAPIADNAEEVVAPRFVEVQDERAPGAGRRTADRAPQASASLSSQPHPQPHPVPPVTGAPRHLAATGAPELPEDPAAAVQAMAAERARVMAERAAAAMAAPSQAEAHRRPSARPSVAVPAAAPEAHATVEAAPQPRTRRMPAPAASSSGLKRGLMVAGLGAVLITSGFAANYLLADRYLGDSKLADRITPAPLATTPPPGQTKSVTIRPPAAAGPSQVSPSDRADAPRPTPTLPEITPSAPRPQPTNQRVPQPAAAPREAPPPQSAPAARPLEEAPAETAPRRRPVPETVTDDLSSNTQLSNDADRPNFAEVMGARVSQAAVQGIALDTSNAMPDPSELARRQARMAPAPALPTAKPNSSSTASLTPPLDPLAGDQPGRTRAIEMPPATIGPASLRSAAQRGDPGAAFEVAVRFAEAKGVKQDFPQALIWYSRAAQAGFVPAQYRLATLYERGLAGDADLPRAKAWYKRAADQGNVKAMHNLAVLSAGPQQDNPDYASAAKWFSEAADRGLADSQFNLGVLHENGLGVTKDLMQAYKWFALAARSGDKEAVRRRDQLLASFSPSMAQSAANVVENWRAKPTDLKANDPRSAAQAWQGQREQMQALAEQQMQQSQPRPDIQPEAEASSPTAKAAVAKVTKAAVRTAPKAE